MEKETKRETRVRLAAEAQAQNELLIAGGSRIPPNPKRLIHALRSIGYSLEQAAADILDNSIAAKANRMLVRVETGESSVERILIVDNGHGMSDSMLEKAMEFGADTNQGPSSLGKYGMGLKLASLSQGEEVIVLSRQNGKSCGRRWTVEGIGDSWRCDIIDPSNATRELDKPLPSVPIEDHGTLVIWSRLDRIRPSKSGLERTVENILTRLKHHIGLHFHRFLEKKGFEIYLDWVNKGSQKPEETVRVVPLNPFGYQPGESGDEEYPKTFTLELPGVGSLELNAHIWEPNSDSPNYKLDGKVAARQGLYFYRNDRLIQAGGWNDSRDSTEPHSSLARVAVDLPPKFDSSFSLDVKKCGVRESPAFSDALRQAKASDGTKFSEYRAAAENTYRKAAKRNTANFPLVPGEGISEKLQRKLKDIVAPNDKRVREVKFRWTELENGEVFEMDREHLTIRLNKRFRRQLLGDERGSSTDLPLLKTLLFLLLRDDIDSGRMSQKQRELMSQIDQSLKLVIKELSAGR